MNFKKRNTKITFNQIVYYVIVFTIKVTISSYNYVLLQNLTSVMTSIKSAMIYENVFK